MYVICVLTDEESACPMEEEFDHGSMIKSENTNSKKRPRDLTSSAQQQKCELPHRKKINKKGSKLSSADRLKLSITSTIQSVRNNEIEVLRLRRNILYCIVL